MNIETPPENPNPEEEVKRLEKKIAEKEAQLEAIKSATLEGIYESGELEKVDKPEQPGWDEAPGIRKALRNMRGIDGIADWYRYEREAFNLELFTETIMQGVWSDVRKSEKFDSGFKEEMRVKKRQYIQYSGDLTMGFDPNVTKQIHEFDPNATDELRKLANNRLTKIGPDNKGVDGKGSYFDRFDENFTDEKGRVRNIGREYQDLIDRHNRTVGAEERVEDSISSAERFHLRYAAGQSMWDIVNQNLADNEFTMMPGSLRGLYVVMRNMDENKLTHYRDRDLDVKIPMVEFLIDQFRDEVLGVRQATKSNLELFTWFVNKAGQNFIPFTNIREDLQDWWEIIKSLLGRPKDSRVQPSKYPYLQDELSGGDESKVIKRINDLRTKKGLPPWTMDDTPFSRIGVTTGYAKAAKKK